MMEWLSGLLARLRRASRPALFQSRAAHTVRIIGASGLFDAAWYLENYPDVSARKVDPINHYVRHGAREGRDPNRLFNSNWYLANNPDVVQAGLNPLAHFVTRGSAEGRSPSPLFDTKWYLEANPDVAAARINPLLHYLRHGAREGRRPNSKADVGAWTSPAAQISSPHDRNAHRKTFDEEAARKFVAAVRSGAGHAALLRDRPLISVILPTRDRATLLPA